MFRTIFSHLTLKAFQVSRKRKVTLVILLVLLLVVLLFRIFGQPLLSFEFGRELFSLISVALITNFILNLIRLPIVSGYRRRNKLSVDQKDNFILGMNALTLLATIIITIVSIFPIFGVDVVGFLTVLGLFAAGFLWSFKETVTSFADGLTMMFSRNYRVGDYIKIDELTKGIIRNIGFRFTQIRTDDGDTMYVPNYLIMNGAVVNYSKAMSKRVSVPFTIPLSSVSNTDHFEDRLTKAIHKEFADITDPEKMNLRILSVSENNIDLSFEIPVSTYNFRVEENVKKFVYTNVIAYSNDKRT